VCFKGEVTFCYDRGNLDLSKIQLAHLLVWSYSVAHWLIAKSENPAHLCSAIQPNAPICRPHTLGRPAVSGRCRKTGPSQSVWVKLPLGYTWVIEHERGDPNSAGLKLHGFDLAEQVCFSVSTDITQQLGVQLV